MPKEKLEKVYRNKTPAKETLERFDKQNELNQKVALTMQHIEDKIESLCKQGEDNKTAYENIAKKIDAMSEKLDEKYTRKDEFIFWRNLLVSGIILAIFVGIMLRFVK